MIFFGLLQFLIILYVCKKEYEYKSLSIVLWATLLLMFGIPHFITTINNDSGYTSYVLNEASLFVIFFCIIYIISRYLFYYLFTNYHISNNEMIKKLNENKSMFLMRFLFAGITIVVLFKLYQIYKHAGGLLVSSWASGREIALNQEYLSASKLILSLYYPFSSALLYALIIKNKKYIILSGTLILISVIFSRNRIEVLPIVICLVIYLLNTQKKMTLKKILNYFLLAYISFYLINALLIFRYYGSIETFINNFNFIEFNNNVSENMSGDKGELNLREVFYFFIQNDNKFTNFNEGHTYLRMLFVIVPTGLINDIKPPDFAISMGKAYSPGLIGFSTHPTLFGDCYANMGVYGIFLAVFWAFYVGFADKLVSNSRSLFIKLTTLVSIASSYAIIARGSVYNSFSILIFGLIITYLIYYILKKIFYNNLNEF